MLKKEQVKFGCFQYSINIILWFLANTFTQEKYIRYMNTKKVFWFEVFVILHQKSLFNQLNP